jgi:hypothetical protein
MPELNQNVLSRRDDIIRELRRIVPGGGFTTYRRPPMVVVLPETAAQGGSRPVRIGTCPARRPLPPGDGRRLTVAYHAACSLQHGQQITARLKLLLAAGKAAGVLFLGLSSRKIGEMAAGRPVFVTSFSAVAPAARLTAQGY